MSIEKNEIDKLIKESLGAEDAKFYEELEEQNFLGKIGQVHKGKMGWLASLMTVLNFVIFAIFIYCAIQFFNAEQTNELIKWSVAGFLCWSFLAMIKLYLWMQIDKNDLYRKLKRLEFQIAVMQNKA